MRTFKQVISTFMLTLVFVFFLAIHSQAQVPGDTTIHKDTTVTPTTTTTTTPTQSTASTPPAEQPKVKSFIIYAGPNISTLRVESEELNKESETGFHVGLSWRTKGAFYTQFGLRYNSPVYSIFPKTGSDSGDHKFTISDIDVPITAGINLLSGNDRGLNLRGYLGVVPAFNIGVGDNDAGFAKDSVNTFVLYGQAGLGVDVAFLVFEVGYNYGFKDIIKNYNSKPGQWFLNIGWRF